MMLRLYIIIFLFNCSSCSFSPIYSVNGYGIAGNLSAIMIDDQKKYLDQKLRNDLVEVLNPTNAKYRETVPLKNRY